MFPPNSELAVCVHVSIWDNFTLLCASRSSLATSTVRVRGGEEWWPGQWSPCWYQQLDPPFHITTNQQPLMADKSEYDECA